MKSEHSIATFIASLPVDERIILTTLREIVLEILPNCLEKFSYGVPYYFINSRICFIWPASVQPGPKKGVQFGLCNAVNLRETNHFLEFGTRKQVGLLHFHSSEEIKKEVIVQLLTEAVIYDQMKNLWRKG